jgi:hypothetical protein
VRPHPIGFSVLALLLGTLACRQPPGGQQAAPDRAVENPAMSATIEQAVGEAARWADIPGVESVGQGEENGRPVIRVLVSTREAYDRIPKTFKQFPVIVQQSSPISAQGGPR